MFTRRQFLSALSLGAGAPLFMPLMRYLWAREDAPVARRVVFVVEGNGLEPVNLLSKATETWFERTHNNTLGNARVFTNAYSFESPQTVLSSQLGSARSLSALAKEGLEDKSAVVFGLSSKIAKSESHSFKYGALGCMRSPGAPAGETIDHALATLASVRGVPVEQGGRGVSPFDAFRGGIHASTTAQASAGLCAYGLGRPAPLLLDQHTAYATLFSSFVEGAPKRQFTSRNRMLDYARRTTERSLATFASSSPERAKLEQYLASIVEMEDRQRILSSPIWTKRYEPLLDPDDTLWRDRPGFDTSKPMERLGLHFDMATAALLGGLTNVCVLGSGFGGGFDITYKSFSIPGLDDVHNRHSLCHSAYAPSLGGNTTDNPYAEYLRQISARHVDMIARMAKRLDQTPEPDGTTMLENTLIVYMSDNGEKHHGSSEEWPMLLVGGQNMGFKTDGRTVLYPQEGKPGNRQVSNLFNTIGHAAGGSQEPKDPLKPKTLKFEFFGAESEAQRRAPGVLSELWENKG